MLTLLFFAQDKKIDISTQVKQTQEKITSLTKKNDLRSKDIEAKQREEDFFTLQRMKQWCKLSLLRWLLRVQHPN